MAFWRGVAHANLAGSAPQRERHIAGLDESIAYLQRLIDRGHPENASHRSLFLRAERARLEGGDDVEELYHQAALEASKGSFSIELGFILQALGQYLHEHGAPVNRVRRAWV